LPIAGAETFVPPLLMWGASKLGAKIQDGSVTWRHGLENITMCAYEHCENRAELD